MCTISQNQHKGSVVDSILERVKTYHRNTSCRAFFTYIFQYVINYMSFSPGRNCVTHLHSLSLSAWGCPDIVTPKHGWVKQKGLHATVGCETASDTWDLTCNGTVWLGQVPICVPGLSTKHFSFVPFHIQRWTLNIYIFL